MDDALLAQLEERTPGLATLFATGSEAILAAADVAALEEARVATLGRKSPLTETLRSISSLAPDQRPAVGKFGNIVRRELEALVEEREAELKQAAWTPRWPTSASTSLFPVSRSRPATSTSSARPCARWRTSSSASGTASPKVPRWSWTTTTSPR